MDDSLLKKLCVVMNGILVCDLEENRDSKKRVAIRVIYSL